MMCCMLGLALGVHAQESVFLQQYREKVKAYNQDIKSAGYAVSIRQEAEKSAKADFLPSLSGNANASYTGNPLELYRRSLIIRHSYCLAYPSPHRKWDL